MNANKMQSATMYPKMGGESMEEIKAEIEEEKKA
jgi:hypothetical protein